MGTRGGSKPGERRGGRDPGVPNRATTQAVLKAEQQIAEARKAGRKIGVDVLDDFMHLFAGMAAHYQPAPPGVASKPHANEDKFLVYAKLAVDTARDLADFQSPKFKAIIPLGYNSQGLPPPPQMPTGATSKLSKVDAYRLLRDVTTIDVTANMSAPALALPKPSRRRKTGG